MTQGEVLEIFREAIMATLKLSGPLLLVSIGIGIIVAIFQAATQIHEQTITFVPKLIAIFFLLLVLGSWMITTLTELFHYLLSIMLTL